MVSISSWFSSFLTHLICPGPSVDLAVFTSHLDNCACPRCLLSFSPLICHHANLPKTLFICCWLLKMLSGSPVSFFSLPSVCFSGLLSFCSHLFLQSELPEFLNCIMHTSAVGDGVIPAVRQPEPTSCSSSLVTSGMLEMDSVFSSVKWLCKNFVKYIISESARGSV